jgi:PAS domain S-box-containing protein
MLSDILCSGEPHPGDGAHDRIHFETLISDISALLVATSPEQVEPVIVAALDRVRVFFQADRCGLLEVRTDRASVFVAHGAYADGLPPISGDINLVQLFPWAAQKLLVERVPAIVHRMADLPPEAAADRASWEQFIPTRSNLAVPLSEEPVVRNIIVMHWVQQECLFPDSFVPRLRVLGEMMLSALDRRRAFDAVRISEERLERAAASARCGLWELDLSTGAIWATPETRAIYGITGDEPTTYDLFTRLVHAADRDAILAAVGEAISDRRSFDETYRIVRPDSAVRWIHATGHAGDGHVLLGASVDVTDMVETSNRAAEQAARLAAAVDVASLGFYELVDRGSATFVDARCRAMFGVPESYSDFDHLPSFWIEHLHPDDRQRILDVNAQLQDGRLDRASAEYRYLHPERGEVWFHHVAHVIARHDDRSAHRTIGVVQDITERKRAEARLTNALEEVQRLRERLERENIYLRQEAKRSLGPGHIVGRSPAIRRTLTLAEQVGPTDSTVLLLGETGSGKERFASYIHECSRRRERPMIRVNCSAIPATLIESELFGREKGAYTGALARQVGRFELAHGSTLFLDEIGELSGEVQVKLLRVLETHTIERLGNPRPIPVDVRIIAATNRDLAAAVRDHRFREDLYYRLNVFPISVPPLRDRREDIPLFVQAFVDELSATMGKRIEDVDPSSMKALAGYAWPGNVRELRNVVERAMIVAAGPILEIEPPQTGTEETDGSVTPRVLSRAHLLNVLEETGWRIRGDQGAAVRLGLKPSTLESRLKKLGVTRPGKIALP